MDDVNWTLEILKLVVAAMAPVVVIAVGLLLDRRMKAIDRRNQTELHKLNRQHDLELKRLDAQQWSNQTLISKRIEIYATVAPGLNQLYCFFEKVGSFKDLEPPMVVDLKRALDTEMHVSRAFFSAEHFQKYQAFMDAYFQTHTGPGRDARIRSSPKRYRKDLSRWDPSWKARFAPKEERTEVVEVGDAYQALMDSFAEQMGASLTPGPDPIWDHPVEDLEPDRHG
jgi:hypothetical protein